MESGNVPPGVPGYKIYADIVKDLNVWNGVLMSLKK